MKYYHLPLSEKECSLKDLQNPMAYDRPCFIYDLNPKIDYITGMYATYGDFVKMVTRLSDKLDRKFVYEISEGVRKGYYEEIIRVRRKDGGVYGVHLVFKATPKNPVGMFLKPSKMNSAFIYQSKIRLSKF